MESTEKVLITLNRRIYLCNLHNDTAPENRFASLDEKF